MSLTSGCHRKTGALLNAMYGSFFYLKKFVPLQRKKGSICPGSRNAKWSISFWGKDWGFWARYPQGELFVTKMSAGQRRVGSFSGWPESLVLGRIAQAKGRGNPGTPRISSAGDRLCLWVKSKGKRGSRLYVCKRQWETWSQLEKQVFILTGLGIFMI